ncbi:hypothetical protein [Bacillus sp. PS06]|uniref:cell division suppressor protein YneA n=1 Tax=Bacillus sp. PS06 TaxID=2764176 RepID=UPI001784C33F|nr:hypothetical protein [Bacillus sp. PS06]MBD8068208.1 hypothetical protein [Bacillus sp. PS06]
MKLSIEGLTYYILFFVLLIGLTLALSTTANGENDHQYVTITLSEGDSLWKVNETFKEHHQFQFFEFVDWVETKNKVNAEALKPGDQLVLPIKLKDNNEILTAYASSEE